MIVCWPLLFGVLAIAPTRVQVRNAHGVTTTIAIRQDPQDGPLIPLNPLAKAVGGAVINSGSSTSFSIASGTFNFLVGTSMVFDGNQWRSLPARAQLRRDTLFVPLSFVSEFLAERSRHAWVWSPASATLSQVHHVVTLDPGHGGIDSGNQGVFFPKGMYEKDANLAIGLLVRDELQKRGVEVTMTRTRDTLINLLQRAPKYCSDCDLFVSLHVNSLEKTSPGYTTQRGFETYFLSAARTEDAARIASFENSSVRYDAPTPAASGFGDLAYTLKDLQANDFIRQSAKAADMMQTQLDHVEDGTNRGVKQANFAVLTTARSPAILVEMGFSTNRADAQMLSTPSGQATLARSIALAIMDYLTDLDRLRAQGGPPP